jgi:hypothetical protein
MRMQYLPRTKILHLLGKAMVKPIMVHPSIHQFETKSLPQAQEDYDGRGQQTASFVFTAIMSGRVGNSARELLSCAEQLAIIYSHLPFF